MIGILRVKTNRDRPIIYRIYRNFKYFNSHIPAYLSIFV